MRRRGLLRWLRKNFDGSVRTAQRYMRVARHLPASKLDATRASRRSQAAVLRAIRGVVFTGPGVRALIIAVVDDEPQRAGPLESDA